MRLFKGLLRLGLILGIITAGLAIAYLSHNPKAVYNSISVTRQLFEVYCDTSGLAMHMLEESLEFGEKQTAFNLELLQSALAMQNESNKLSMLTQAAPSSPAEVEAVLKLHQETSSMLQSVLENYRSSLNIVTSARQKMEARRGRHAPAVRIDDLDVVWSGRMEIYDYNRFYSVHCKDYAYALAGALAFLGAILAVMAVGHFGVLCFRSGRRIMRWIHSGYEPNGRGGNQ